MAESAAERRAARRKRFSVDELFADHRPQAVGVSDLANAKEIALTRIVPDPDQPRRTIDTARLEELAESIRIEGVLQPIVVRYDEPNDRYIIIHGERRWRAAELAQLPAIPALVREVPEERRLIQQLMENIVRDDLNAVDRSVALRTLKQRLGNAPWEDVASAVGIKRSRLFQLLNTEKLPEPIQDDIRAGRMSEKQSRALQNLAPPLQIALRDEIVEHALPADDAMLVARKLRHSDAPEDERKARALVTAIRDDIAEGITPEPISPPAPHATPPGEQARAALASLSGVARGSTEAVSSLAAFVAEQRASPRAYRKLDDQVLALTATLARLHAAPQRDRDAARPLLESLRDTLTALLDGSNPST